MSAYSSTPKITYVETAIKINTDIAIIEGEKKFTFSSLCFEAYDLITKLIISPISKHRTHNSPFCKLFT